MSTLKEKFDFAAKKAFISYNLWKIDEKITGIHVRCKWNFQFKSENFLFLMPKIREKTYSCFKTKISLLNHS